uniref:Alpha-tocopherol transfer protein-like n=1 Tax=Saccoglossus kowalevskii TaxID=10224 RepID=A0ABM0MR73_SACKO|nr:PREDICTED: alpha-tocopherol transfer protein-like [Saccoglossus kowalevskii]
MASHTDIDLKPEEEFVSTLSPELLQKATRELNEKPEWRQRDIQALRDMFTKRPDINFCSDNGFLLRFLRAKKFDYERAFQMLVNYYEIRKQYPGIYNELLPSNIKHIWDNNLQAALPSRDQEGRRIVIFRPGKWDPSEYPVQDLIKANLLTVEKLLEDEETQVNGIVLIGDLKGFRFSHAMHLGPLFAKQVTSIFQNAMPIRIKGMHYVNEPRLFDAVFAVVRPFLKEKLKNRARYFTPTAFLYPEVNVRLIRIHGSDFTSLHECIPSSSLPADYGGSLPFFTSRQWKDAMLKSDNEFKESSKYGVMDDGEMKEFAETQ